MKRVLVIPTLIGTLVMAGSVMANPPPPSISVSQERIAGTGKWRTKLTFEDKDGVQNARYVDPDTGETVNLGGDCKPKVEKTVVTSSRIVEAHAEDCEQQPHIAHWVFALGESGFDNWGITITVPKRNPTITIHAPAGWTGQEMRRSETRDGKTEIVVQGTKPKDAGGFVRISIDPDGELFLYDVAVAPQGPPTEKPACDDGVWVLFTDPEFKTHGDCVSFAATGGRDPGGG